MKAKLPDLDTLPDGTSIRLTSGHTFTRRVGGWYCPCEPRPWQWPNVRAYCERHGVVDVELPATAAVPVPATVGLPA